MNQSSLINKITRNGRGMLLAYDHGFEHGPVDFDEQSVDPARIMKIADSGHFTGVIFQKGIAAKYYDKDKYKVPLIVKLNGHTAFHKGEEPVSLQNCSVAEAIELGAAGAGYTIYVGSEHEQKMIAEFARVEQEAHRSGLAVIGWMYPRGRHVKSDADRDTLAYAARLGLELNCDAVKIKYTGDVAGFRWVVKSAGKCAVFVVGGEASEDETAVLARTRDILAVGAAGWAIGRNIWQAKNPIALAKKIADIVYK